MLEMSDEQIEQLLITMAYKNVSLEHENEILIAENKKLNQIITEVGNRLKEAIAS